MELEKSKEILNKFCEYEDSVVLIDNALIEIQEAIEAVLQALDNSIPKEKVKKKIDKLQYLINNGETDYSNADFEYQIDMLEKLMEE